MKRYSDNIETFIKSEISELESRTFAANIHVQTYLSGTKEGEILAENIEEWARADQLELSGLSNDLRTAVENALQDGIIDVNEEQAISALQEKISNITSRWREAETQAKWDWMNQEYGHLSAADLESGSFTDLLGAVRDQREEAKAAVQEDVTAWYAELRGMESAGRISSSERKQYESKSMAVVRNQEGIEIAKGLDLGVNTLQDAYGSTIASNLEDIGNTGGATIQRLNEGAASGNWSSALVDSTFDSSLQFYSKKGGADRRALASLYEEMKPDVSDMASLIDQYQDAGQAVPRALMDSFNDAIDIGAAAGDSDAAWQKYANSILESGSAELKEALTDPGNDMYETLRNRMPEELRTAIDRAFAETTDEEYTLDGLRAEINGEAELNGEDLQAQIQEELNNFEDAVSGSGSQVEVTTDGVQVTLGEVEVDGQSALEQIAEAVNMTADELAQANGYESAVEVPVGAKITIPPEAISFETSELEGAAQEAADQVEPGTVEMQAESNTTVVPGEVDNSQVDSAIQEQAGSEAESVSMTAAADAEVTANTVDASQAQEQIQSEVEGAFGEAIPISAAADVTLTQTNNASVIYSEVNTQVQSTFSAGFATTASVAITLDWSIVNPTANISVGGAGSGSATVSASLHADGGFVNGPELSWIGEDGPEAIIPLGGKRRARGVELWNQVGNILGIPQHADGGIFALAGSGAGTSYFDAEDDEGEETGEKKVGVSIPESGGNNVQISLNMNPSFEISGDDPDAIMQMIKARFRELADDFCEAIGEQISDNFSNMPV